MQQEINISSPLGCVFWLCLVEVDNMQIYNVSGTIIKSTQVKEGTQDAYDGVGKEILLIQLCLCIVLKELNEAEATLGVVAKEGGA